MHVKYHSSQCDSSVENFKQPVISVGSFHSDRLAHDLLKDFRSTHDSLQQDLQHRPDVTKWLTKGIPFDVVHINAIDLTNAVELGRGGQGVVRRIYTAGATALVLKQDLVPVDPAEYTKQLRIAAQLVDCPYIVQYRAVVVKLQDGMSGNLAPCGLLMEDLGDVTLHKWARAMRKQTGLDRHAVRKRLQEICRDVLRGLQALHLAGVVHMDVKPANIVIAASGRATLIDLGLAERACSTHSRAGTEGFRAPEVEVGETSHPTAASDMWSLGATMRWCVGTVFDERKTDAEDMVALWDLIARLTDPIPAHRPTATSVLSQELKAVDADEAFDSESKQGKALLIAASQFLGQEWTGQVSPYGESSTNVHISLLHAARSVLRSERVQAWHYAQIVADYLHTALGHRANDEEDDEDAFQAALLRVDVWIASNTMLLVGQAGRLAFQLRTVATTSDRAAEVMLRFFRVAQVAGCTSSFLLPTDDELSVIDDLNLRREVANIKVMRGDRDSLLQAIKEYDDFLRVTRATHGDSHPSVASMLGNQAVALGRLGDPESLRRAIALCDEALRIQRATFDDNDPSVGWTLETRASVLQELGDRDSLLQAIRDYDEVLRIHSASLDENHSHVAYTLANKATALLELGDRESLLTSVALNDQVLRIMRATLGCKHPNVASALAITATALQKLGDRGSLLRAIGLYDEALQIKRTTVGADQLSVAVTLRDKADALQDLGDRESLLCAVGLCDEALRIQRATLGDSDPSVALTLCTKLNAMQALGDDESLFQAISNYDEVLRIKRATFGDNHPSVATALGQKACALQELGDRDSVLQAIRLYSEALRIERVALGENHPRVAATLGNKASLLQKIGDRETVLLAIGDFDEVLRIQRATLGEDHPHFAFTLANKASAHQKLGDRQSVLQAARLCDEALRIMRATIGDDHPDTLKMLMLKDSVAQTWATC